MSFIQKKINKSVEDLEKALDRYESLDLDTQKKVAYYASQLNMYGNSSLELVKALMTLSSGAIGLLIALPALKDRTASSCFEITLTITTFAAFIFCVCCTVFILKTNGNFLIESIIGSEKEKSEAKRLMWAEWLAIASFAIGIVGAATLATYAKIGPKEMNNGGSEKVHPTNSYASAGIGQTPPSTDPKSGKIPDICPKSARDK